MMLPQERYVLSETFVIVRWFSQKLQAHKVNMIKREKLARHPRTIWRIWACDVTPTSRIANPFLVNLLGVQDLVTRVQQRRTPLFETKAAISFMPKIVYYQTSPVWFIKNEYIVAKINVYCSLLPSNRLIGWDIKVTSHPNSNASLIKHLYLPYLVTIAKFDEVVKMATAPNWSVCRLVFNF